MANFTAGTTFTDGVTNDVTAAKLNALVADAVPTSNLSLNSTTGTISNFTASTANITLGTIPTLTAGTTTSTAATITTGTIPTLTAGTTTSTAATITSATITTGTIPTLVATTLVTTGTGTAAAPSIVPTGDTNTGLFFPAADTIAFAEGGTEAMRIDSSGNVGVGTNAPLGRLTTSVSGGSAGSVNNQISMTHANASTGYYIATIRASGTDEPAGFVLKENSTERLRIDSSGQVGIGVSSPSARTHIKTTSAETLRLERDGTAGQISSLTLYDGGGSFSRISSGSGYLAFDTNGATERLRIDSSGNVGIGDSSPSALLALYKNSASDTRLQIGNSSSGSGNTNGLGIGIESGGANTFIYSYENGYMYFGTNGTERLRIDSSGNLLVGTTSANPSGATTDGRVVIQATGGGASALVCYTSTTTAYNVISIENGNGQVGRIQTNASATSYLTSSDYRLKENVMPLTDGLAKVALLKPCVFKWKVDGTDGQGFIAHELQEVCPYAVGGEKDAVNANGEIEPQGIDQSKIVPILTAALKEAIAEIETLKTKVAALEAA